MTKLLSLFCKNFHCSHDIPIRSATNNCQPYGWFHIIHMGRNIPYKSAVRTEVTNRYSLSHRNAVTAHLVNFNLQCPTVLPWWHFPALSYNNAQKCVQYVDQEQLSLDPMQPPAQLKALPKSLSQMLFLLLFHTVLKEEYPLFNSDVVRHFLHNVRKMMSYQSSLDQTLKHVQYFYKHDQGHQIIERLVLVRTSNSILFQPPTVGRVVPTTESILNLIIFLFFEVVLFVSTS